MLTQTGGTRWHWDSCCRLGVQHRLGVQEGVGQLTSHASLSHAFSRTLALTLAPSRPRSSTLSLHCKQYMLCVTLHGAINKATHTLCTQKACTRKEGVQQACTQGARGEKAHAEKAWAGKACIQKACTREAGIKQACTQGAHTQKAWGLRKGVHSSEGVHWEGGHSTGLHPRGTW